MIRRLWNNVQLQLCDLRSATKRPSNMRVAAVNTVDRMYLEKLLAILTHAWFSHFPFVSCCFQHIPTVVLLLPTVVHNVPHREVQIAADHPQTPHHEVGTDPVLVHRIHHLHVVVRLLSE